MVDRSSVSGLVMVAIAVVSTGVILASYDLIHRGLETNLKLDSTIDQRRQSRTKRKKKVRFADDVTAADNSTDGDESCMLRGVTTGPSGGHVRPALRKAACSSTCLVC